MMQRAAFLVLLAALAFGAPARAASVTMDPPGNRNAEQPPIPGGSASRTRAMKTTYDAKYERVYQLLKTDDGLRRKIRAAAARYQIDPMHIVGALVGEHTYNVDVYDRLQTYYVKAISYLKSALSFDYHGESLGSPDLARPSSATARALRQLRSLGLPRARLERHVPRQGRGRARLSERQVRRHVLPALLRRPDLRDRPAQPADGAADERSGAPGVRPAAARLQRSAAGLPHDHGSRPDAGICRGDAAQGDRRLSRHRRLRHFRQSGHHRDALQCRQTRRRGPRSCGPKTRKRRAQGLKPKLPEENYYGWLVNEKLPELQQLFR